MDTKYTHRYLARFIIEAKTPLAIGSGAKNMLTDQIVSTDVNGLPYIPGTSIAGVVRHSLGEKIASQFFGSHGNKSNDGGKGSEIIFTSAQLINEKGIVLEGLLSSDNNTPFLKHYKSLPVRQHVRINLSGTAVDAGKFDEQVVFKGSRFCFEAEMVSDGSNADLFEKALSEICAQNFRLGGGTRSGFGEIEVISCKISKLDLRKSHDLKIYLRKSSSLSDTSFWENYSDEQVATQDNAWQTYNIQLKADDFFLFGSGFGDEDADMTPVSEKQIVWKDGIATFVEKNILIPASSVKGAISHRVAFHYNKLKGVYADQIELNSETEQHTGSKNKAVRELFGSEDPDTPLRGNVLFSDVIQQPINREAPEKILNHVSIDRFTGGACEGALFTEKATNGTGQLYSLKINVLNRLFEEESQKEVILALHLALRDLTNGMLPLGGGTNRGNGCFSGTITFNNGEELYYE